MVSLDLQEKTVRFHLFGRRAPFISRAEFLAALNKNGVEDMKAMWKGESSFEIFVTFKFEASALHIQQTLKEFAIGYVNVFASKECDIFNDVRIHWAPMHIGTVFFNKYFEEKGFTVVSAKLEIDSNDGLFNGVRSYRLMGNKKQWHDLPHVVNFLEYGFQALVKVTGREPLCLRCRKFGHQRAQCNQMRGGLMVRRQEETRIQQENQNVQKPHPDVGKPSPDVSETSSVWTK
ncbi:hypothetical protein ACOMHN_011119 [Nucella lapillus]